MQTEPNYHCSGLITPCSCVCVCVCVCVRALAHMHARILVPVFGTQHGAVHTVGLNESMWKKQ